MYKSMALVTRNILINATRRIHSTSISNVELMETLRVVLPPVVPTNTANMQSTTLAGEPKAISSRSRQQIKSEVLARWDQQKVPRTINPTWSWMLKRNNYE